MTSTPKLVFAEGCFDEFEGTPDELAELIAELHSMAADGTLMSNAEPLSDEDVDELENKTKETRQ